MKNSQKKFILIATLVVSIVSALTGVIAIYMNHELSIQTNQHIEEQKLKELLSAKLDIYQKTRDLFFHDHNSIWYNNERLKKIQGYINYRCNRQFPRGVEDVVTAIGAETVKEYKKEKLASIKKLDQIKIISMNYFDSYVNELLTRLDKEDWWNNYYKNLRELILREMETEIKCLNSSISGLSKKRIKLPRERV